MKRIRKKVPGRKPGPVPMPNKVRFMLTCQAEHLAQMRECAADANMPLSVWIVGIVLAEIERANRQKLIEGAKKKAD